MYIDDVAIVLVRDTPENHPWLDRLQLDCGKQSFTPRPMRRALYSRDFYANVGTIELFLGRLMEAQQALERSAELAPEDPIVHLALAKLYVLQRAPDNAEREFKTAVSLRSSNADARYAFAIFYVLQERFAEARPLALEAAQLDAHPASAYSLLGRIDLGLHEPDRALADFDRAERTATEWRGAGRPECGVLHEDRRGVAPRPMQHATIGRRRSHINKKRRAVRRAIPNFGCHWPTCTTQREKRNSLNRHVYRLDCCRDEPDNPDLRYRALRSPSARANSSR